jgi:hypothetical protein
VKNKTILTYIYLAFNFISLQFSPDAKVYTYHLLYTGSDLLADIGGYLGLFLGLSIFGLIKVFEKVFRNMKKKLVRVMIQDC